MAATLAAAPYLTTLVRTVEHPADQPCDRPDTSWRGAWRRAHGQAEDTPDRDAIEDRAEVIRALADPLTTGDRCSHIEVRVAPADLNPPRDVKRAMPDVAARITR